MKEEKVKEILQRHQLNFQKYSTIYGTIRPNAGAYHLGFGNMMHTMKDHVIHLGAEGVVVMAVDDNSGVLKEETLKFFPRETVRSIRMQVKLFSFLMTITMDQGEIQYKIRKSALGLPWHKENLSYLLLNMTK